jgi:hypothetical protein
MIVTVRARMVNATDETVDLEIPGLKECYLSIPEDVKVIDAESSRGREMTTEEVRDFENALDDLRIMWIARGMAKYLTTPR